MTSKRNFTAVQSHSTKPSKRFKMTYACFIFVAVLASVCTGLSDERDMPTMGERVNQLEKTIKDVLKSETNLKARLEELEARETVLLDKIYALEAEKGSGKLSRNRRQTSQVAFTAYLDHDVHNMADDEVIKYNQVLLNHGAGYDNSTGIFTAPSSGVYLFSWSSSARVIPSHYERQTDLFTKLTVNGVHMLGAVAESVMINDDEQGRNTAVLSIKQGDKVWTAHIGRGGTSLYGEPEERTNSFTGVLLYQLEDNNNFIIG